MARTHARTGRSDVTLLPLGARLRRSFAADDPANRIAAMALGLAAAAALVLAVTPVLPPALPGFVVPWWLLAILYALAEVNVVHLSLGKETHSFSLTEVPLVVGLVAADPVALVLGQLVGSALALRVHRGQRGLKLGFNLALFALSTGVAALVSAGLRDAGGLTPSFWLAILVACLCADLVSGAAVECAISISTGEPARWRKLIGPGLLYTATNAIVGIAIVLLFAVRPEAVILGAVITGAILWAYRASDQERRKRDALALIHEATRGQPGGYDPLPIVTLILHTARRLSGSRSAAITVPSDGTEESLEYRLDPDGVDVGRRVVPAAIELPGTHPRSEPTDRLVPWHRRLRLSWPRPQARGDERLTASIPGPPGVAGVLEVTGRAISARRWSSEDLTTLQTLANHAGVALGNARLLAEMARRAEENDHLAHHDTLTGLPNRLRLEELLRDAVSDPAFDALLLLDVDAFKEVNDTLGHATGDRLLVELAGRLAEALRGREVVARISGDEFAALAFAPPCPARVDAGEALAERIQAALIRPIPIDALRLSVAASIGIARMPSTGADGDTLLRRADVAMYVAKRERTGVALYAPELDGYDPARLALAEDLRAAVHAGDLEVWYQPKVDLATRAPIGAEALVRWRHPTAGWVPPDVFVPIVEQTNLLTPMTRHVIRHAVAHAARMRMCDPRFHVAVNLSARSLLDRDLCSEVEHALDSAGLDPEALVLEITESAAMAEADRVLPTLHALRSLGVGIAIDDFGTGHSSLAYLRSLPATELKIDRSFLVDIVTDPHARAIVTAAVQLGHILGMQVIAEGVETEDVHEVLLGLGCDLGQGWLYGRPRAVDAGATDGNSTGLMVARG